MEGHEPSYGSRYGSSGRIVMARICVTEEIILEIAKATGFHYNGEWQIDRRRFILALEIAFRQGYNAGFHAESNRSGE